MHKYPADFSLHSFSVCFSPSGSILARPAAFFFSWRSPLASCTSWSLWHISSGFWFRAAEGLLNRLRAQRRSLKPNPEQGSPSGLNAEMANRQTMGAVANLKTATAVARSQPSKTLTARRLSSPFLPCFRISSPCQPKKKPPRHRLRGLFRRDGGLPGPDQFSWEEFPGIMSRSKFIVNGRMASL